MQIILGQEAADALKNNYTVLELETFLKEGEEVKAFCVVTDIPVMELPELEQDKALHAMFVSEYYNGNYQFCLENAFHLKGKFNGELDSFYEEIINRISAQADAV
jgi:hypothetical protein